MTIERTVITERGNQLQTPDHFGGFLRRVDLQYGRSATDLETLLYVIEELNQRGRLTNPARAAAVVELLDPHAGESTFTIHGYTINLGIETAVTDPDGNVTELTRLEAKILKTLVLCANTPVKPSTLACVIDHPFPDSDGGANNVATHICRLRKKFGEKNKIILKSKKSEGYTFITSEKPAEV